MSTRSAWLSCLCVRALLQAVFPYNNWIDKEHGLTQLLTPDRDGDGKGDALVNASMTDCGCSAAYARTPRVRTINDPDVLCLNDLQTSSLCTRRTSSASVHGRCLNQRQPCMRARTALGPAAAATCVRAHSQGGRH